MYKFLTCMGVVLSIIFSWEVGMSNGAAHPECKVASWGKLGILYGVFTPKNEKVGKSLFDSEQECQQELKRSISGPILCTITTLSVSPGNPSLGVMAYGLINWRTGSQIGESEFDDLDQCLKFARQRRHNHICVQSGFYFSRISPKLSRRYFKVAAITSGAYESEEFESLEDCLNELRREF